MVDGGRRLYHRQYTDRLLVAFFFLPDFHRLHSHQLAWHTPAPEFRSRTARAIHSNFRLQMKKIGQRVRRRKRVLANSMSKTMSATTMVSVAAFSYWNDRT